MDVPMLLCQIRAAPWVREAAACGSRPPIAPRLADGDSQGMRVAYAFEATRLARRHPAARRATLSRWPVVAGIGCAHAELARSTVARSCTASWAATVVVVFVDWPAVWRSLHARPRRAQSSSSTWTPTAR